MNDGELFSATLVSIVFIVTVGVIVFEYVRKP